MAFQMPEEDCMSMLLYTVQLLSGNKAFSSNPFVTLDNKGTFYNRVQISLTVKRIPRHRIRKLLTERLNVVPSIDYNSIVVLHPCHLTKLRIVNGSWNIVKMQGKYISSASRKRWVRLYCHEVLPKDECYVSSELHRNCNLDRSELLVMSVTDPAMCELARKTSYLFYTAVTLSRQDLKHISSPCIAKSVYIAIIEHPDYKVSAKLDCDFQHYFSYSRLVCVGDILAVNFIENNTKDLTSNNSLSIPKSVYFLVNKIECSYACGKETCHLMRLATTKVVLSESCQSAELPCCDSVIADDGSINIPTHLEEKYYHIKSIIRSQLLESEEFNSNNNESSNKFPPSINVKLSENNRNLKTVIKNFNKQTSSQSVPVLKKCSPYSNADSTNKSSWGSELGHILLQGNSVEIKILLQYLQGSLGCCVYTVECWRLKSDTSGATEVKLTQALLCISSTVPFVLVLLGVDILVKSSTSGTEDSRVCLALCRCLRQLSSRNTLVLATCDRNTTVPGGLWRLFSYQEQLASSLTTSDREKLALWFLANKYSSYVQFNSNTLSSLTVNSFTVNKNGISNNNSLDVKGSFEGASCESVSTHSNSGHSNDSDMLSELVSVLTHGTVGYTYATMDVVLQNAVNLCCQEWDDTMQETEENECDEHLHTDLMCESGDQKDETKIVTNFYSDVEIQNNCKTSSKYYLEHECNSKTSACADPIRNKNLDLARSKRKAVLHPIRPLLQARHIKTALEELNKERRQGVSSMCSVPRVEWKDVGGLDQAKKELVNAIHLPLRYPHLLGGNIRRAGVLLYGPPGTGKTLLAKAVASECGLNFMSVKGPELLNMYVGQSEQNVRQVFEQARSAAPCVIFFDELDALTPNRGASGDSGGVMDRVVSAVLAELDECSSSSDASGAVFVLAATNRPDLLDPALLRPGRFEKLVYLGPCTDAASLLKILRVVTNKLPFSSDVSLERVVQQLPAGLTGADLASVATEAFYIALRSTVADIEQGLLESSEARLVVTEQHLLTAATSVTPSVSQQQLAQYTAYNNSNSGNR